MLKDLIDLYSQLETKEVNKEELRQRLDLMNSLLNDIKDKFTQESMEALEAEIAKATTILEKEDATQEEVDSTLVKLNDAYKALQIKEETTNEVDTSVLERFIQKLNVKLEEIQMDKMDIFIEA